MAVQDLPPQVLEVKSRGHPPKTLVGDCISMPENTKHSWAEEITDDVDDDDAQRQSAVKPRQAAPRPTLSVLDAVALIVGVVVGAGIFKTPALVAAHAGGPGLFLLAWLVGGVISLIGALCYAELATAYPHTGGDYHYLRRAFGHDMAFLFAWARMMVLQTGSIAMLSFVFGDYALQLLPIGQGGAALYAALAIALVTTLNLLGVQQGKSAQKVLTTAKVLGVLSIVVAGLLVAPAAPAGAADAPPRTAFGLAMIFVLLTYGGWNEAAYMSGEVRHAQRNMLWSLLWAISLIAAIFILANLAYLKGLGLTAMSGSDVVAADVMRRVAGPGGATFVSALIAIAALGSMNATTFTGARSMYALGQDYQPLGFLGRWRGGRNTPANALLVQGSIALLLVLLGAWARDGFVTMVEYTAPVFWFFFLLVGLSLFVLRTQEPERPRPFRVPLYPVTPLIFCVTCVYMLHSSLAYTGPGAVVGVGVLLAGVPLLFLARPHHR
jgi:basic amino acid/polyamine antiporter, APA family